MIWQITPLNTVIIDLQDYKYLCQFTWCRSQKGYFYARSGLLRDKRLHRVIAEQMGLDLSYQIDHKNQNKLDNSRKNLRQATNGLNRANSKLNINNKSGLKGVHLRKQRPMPVDRKLRSDRFTSRWVAQINVKGKKIHLGYFSTPEQAATKYKEAAIKYFGEFAST